MLNRPSDVPVVLLYHSVGLSSWAVSAESFAAQISYLVRERNVIALDSLCWGKLELAIPRSVVITFDDGYNSLLYVAAPILAQNSCSATVYLNTGWIGGTEGRTSDPSLGHYPNEMFLTWPEAERLADLGWTIGSHGVDHVDLTRCTPADMAEQLALSRMHIVDRGFGACHHFAYTWGRHSTNLTEAVKRAGYLDAAAGIHGRLTPTVNRYAFPRINIDRYLTLDDFRAVMCGDWDYLKWFQRTRELW